MINDLKQEVMARKLSLKEGLKKTGGNCSGMLLILGILAYGIGFLIILIIKAKGAILGIHIATNREANIIYGIK